MAKRQVREVDVMPKVQIMAKEKSATNTSMRTESNVKGSDDGNQKSMT